MSFRLFSHSLEDGGTLPMKQVFDQFGFTGENISPHLAWEDAPADTQSFVLTMYDPDAPTGSGWWHWVVIDIPGTVHELAEGAGAKNGTLPGGAQEMRTDAGVFGYGGAAPPPGSLHRYVFTLFALNTDKLGVDAGASAAMVGYVAHMHTLEKASLTVTFGT